MAMRTIDVRFKSLEELPIAELFGVYGVYVLWAPTARDCPTYLGEGIVLSRLNEHVKWLKSGVTGIAATVDSKREAEAVGIKVVVARIFKQRLSQPSDGSPG
jgi:hypothetical protein